MQLLQTDTAAVGADIIIMTESWLKQQHSNDPINLPGFSTLRKDRTKRKVGGVCVFITLRFNDKLLNVQKTIHDTEDLWFSVTLDDGLTVNFCACYHPPKRIYDTKLFREYLFEIIEGLIDNQPGSVFVLNGDLNGLRTAELQSQLGGDQLVDKPTHSNNIINVFLTNKPDMFNVEVGQSLLKTKHKALVIKAKFEVTKPMSAAKSEIVKVWEYTPSSASLLAKQ